MDPSNAELGCCSSPRSTSKAPPSRTIARPQAAPRILNGPNHAGGAAGEGGPLDSPRPDTRLAQLEEVPNNPGHECIPVPRLRGSYAAATIQSTRKSYLSPPRFMRKSMGDSTQLAVAVDATDQSTGRQLPATTLAPIARPRSKPASKKEVDVVIEIPFDAGRAFRGHDYANGTVQGTSLPVLPPVPPAEEPAVTETPVNVGEESTAIAVQRRRDLFLLRSISKSIGTVVSHLFGIGYGSREPLPSTVEPDSARQPRNPLEVSVEIQVCPEARPAQSTVSAQSATPSAVFQERGAYQPTDDQLEGRAQMTLSLTQVVTVKPSPRKSPKRKVEDELSPEKESRRRGREENVPTKIPTRASPRDRTLKDVSPEATSLSRTTGRGGESRKEVAAAKPDAEVAKKAPDKTTEESLERALSSFEERKVSSTLQEKRASTVDLKGKSGSPAKKASRKAKAGTKRVSSPGGIESSPGEVQAEAKVNVAGRLPIAESVKSVQKHEDMNLEEAPLEGTHSPKQTALKSSLKKTTSSEHLAEMLDVYTKRAEMLRSETKKKGDRKRGKSAEAEVVSAMSPEVMSEVFEGITRAAKAESPKADERKKVPRGKRKASKIEVVSMGSAEAVDEGFTGVTTAAKAESPKAVKKTPRDKRKASKMEVRSPGYPEANHELLAGATEAKVEGDKKDGTKRKESAGSEERTENIAQRLSAEPFEGERARDNEKTAVQQKKSGPPEEDNEKQSPGLSKKVHEAKVGKRTRKASKSPLADKLDNSAERLKGEIGSETTTKRTKGDAGEKRKSSLRKQKTDTAMQEAIDEIKSGTAQTHKSKKKKTEPRQPDENAEVITSAEPFSKDVGEIRISRKAQASGKKAAEEKPAVTHTEHNVEATVEGTVREVAEGKDKTRKKTSGKSGRGKKSPDADDTREAQSPMRLEDSNARKAGKMTSSPRKTGVIDVGGVISKNKDELEKEAKTKAFNEGKRGVSKHGKITGYKKPKKDAQAAGKNGRKAAGEEDRLGEEKKAPGISDEDNLKLAALFESGQKEAMTAIGPEDAEQNETPSEVPKEGEETRTTVLGESLAKAEKAAEILTKGAEGAGTDEDDDVVRVVRKRRDSIAVHRMAGIKRTESRPVTDGEPEAGGPLSFALGKRKRDGEGGKEATVRTSGANKTGVRKPVKTAGYKEPKEEHDQTAGKQKQKAAEGEEKKAPGISDEDSVKFAALFESGQKEAMTAISPEDAEQKETPSEVPKGGEETRTTVLGESLAKAEKAAEILTKGAEGAGTGEDDDVVRVVRKRRDSIAVHRMAGIKRKESRPVTEGEPEVEGPLSFTLGRKKAGGKDDLEDGESRDEQKVQKSALKTGRKRTSATAARGKLIPEKADHGLKPTDTKRTSSVGAKSPTVVGGLITTTHSKLPSKPAGTLHQGTQGPLKASGADSLPPASKMGPATRPQPPSAGSAYLGMPSSDAGSGSPTPVPLPDWYRSTSPVSEDRRATDAARPQLSAPVSLEGAPRLLGPQVPGTVPMGAQPTLDVDSRMNLVAMRGRMMFRPGRRKYGKGRGRKGPYAVGDSASKDLPPDKMKFSRIKLSAKQPRGAEEKHPPVLHSPILDIGSPFTSPRGGSPVVSPTSTVIMSGIPEHDTGPDVDVAGTSEGAATNGDVARSIKAARKAVDRESPKGVGAQPTKRKKKKRAHKTTRSNLKPQSEILSMQEMLSQIRKRKMEHEAATAERRKAADEEHIPEEKHAPKTKKGKKVKKKKVEKRTVDTQTSLPFVEPETPAVMLQSGDRRLCDFRFTVGADRVVRGAILNPESLEPHAQEENALRLPSPVVATEAAATSRPVLSTEPSSTLSLPYRDLDLVTSAAPPAPPGEEPEPPSLAGAVPDTFGVGGEPSELPPPKRDKQAGSRKRAKPKRESRSRIKQDRKQRKKKRAPKHASSVAFLFRWRAPTAPRTRSNPTSAVYPLSTEGMAPRLPGLHARQLPRLFSWTTKTAIPTTAKEGSKLFKPVPDVPLTGPTFESAVGTLRTSPISRVHAGSASPVSGAAAQDESGGDAVQGKKGRQKTIPRMQEAVHVYQFADASVRSPLQSKDRAGFCTEELSLTAQDRISSDTLPRKRGKGDIVTDMQLIVTGFESEIGSLREPPLPANRTGFNKAKPSTVVQHEKGGDALQGRKDATVGVQQVVPVFESAKEPLHMSPLPAPRAGFGKTKPSVAATDERGGEALSAERNREKAVADIGSVEDLSVDGAGVTAKDEKRGGACEGKRGKGEIDVFLKAPTSALLGSATVMPNSTALQSLAEETRISPELSVAPQDSALPKKSAAIVVPGTGRSAEPLLHGSEEETFKSTKKRKHGQKENGEDKEGRDKSLAKPPRKLMEKKADKLDEEDKGAHTRAWQEEGEKDGNETEPQGFREGKKRENESPKTWDVGGETDRSGSPQVKYAKSISPDANVPVSRRFESKWPGTGSAMTRNYTSEKHGSRSPERRTDRSMSSNNGSRSPSRESRRRSGKAYMASSLRKRSPEADPGLRSSESKRPEYLRPDKQIHGAATHTRRKRRSDSRARPESKHIARKKPDIESSHYRSSDDHSTERKISESNEHKIRTQSSSESKRTSRSRGSKLEASRSAHSKTRQFELTSSARTRSAINSMSKADQLRGSAPVRRRGASESSSTSSLSQLSSSRSESRLSESTSSRERRRRRHKRKRARSGRRGTEQKRKQLPPPGRSPSSHGSGRRGRHSDRLTIRSIDRVAGNAYRTQNLACCCLLFLGASVVLLLALSTSVLYFVLKTSPAPLVSHNKTETKTYSISTRSTKETFIPVTGIIYYCDTAFCSQEARYVASVVKSGRRPCANFYEHVCDEWLGQQTTYPAGVQSPPSRDSILQDSLAQQLLRLIRNSPERDIKTAANLYHACAVNRSAHATSEDKAALKTIFGRWEIRLWPRTDRENLSALSVWRLAAELARDLDIATLFIVSVGVDPGDVGATILELDSLRLLLSDTDTEYEQAAALYKSAIRETVTELNATVAFPLDDFADRLINVSRVLRSTSLQATSSETLTVLRVDELGEGVRHFVEMLLSNVSGRPIKVVARSPSYVRANLQTALLSVPPLDVINYMGFQVFVRLVPFLPERLRSLRTLFSKSVVGRTFADVTDTSRLCLWLVEHTLPRCFTKASHHWLRQRGQQEPLREWLEKLESVFLRHVADFVWVSNLSSLLVRYRFKRRQVTQFGSLKEDHSCAPVVPRDTTAHPLRYYLNLSTYKLHWRLRGLEANSTVLRQRSSFDSGSELRTVATFDQTLHRVHVPAALFNLSVPSNSTFFVFQLARVAVRFYRGMVQALYENPHEREVPLSFTDESRRRLGDLTTCFSSDAQRSLGAVQGAGSPPLLKPSLAGKLLLDQTSALLLSLKAFDELLHARRMWETDHRLRDLPLHSAQQLFFIYFALDNCESTQAASRGDHGMSANFRVNVPLRHVRLFAEAFNCTFADQMAHTLGGSCDVLRSSTRQLVQGGQRSQRGTRPMEVFEPVD